MEKGEGRWADPSTQKYHTLAWKLLTRVLAQKNKSILTFVLSSVAINNGIDSGQDPFDNDPRRRAFEKWDLRKFTHVALKPRMILPKKV